MIKQNTGYTLVELLIVTVIVGVVASIAIPSYRTYVENGCMKTARINILALAGAENNYYLENGTYLGGDKIVDGDGNVTSDSLSAPLHWSSNDKNKYNYTVTAAAKSANIVVTSPECTGSETLTVQP